MTEPRITYETDDDIGLITMFVDGKKITEWSYEEDPEASFDEFKKIFNAGRDWKAP